MATVAEACMYIFLPSIGSSRRRPSNGRLSLLMAPRIPGSSACGSFLLPFAHGHEHGHRNVQLSGIHQRIYAIPYLALRCHTNTRHHSPLLNEEHDKGQKRALREHNTQPHPPDTLDVLQSCTRGPITISASLLPWAFVVPTPHQPSAFFSLFCCYCCCCSRCFCLLSTPTTGNNNCDTGSHNDTHPHAWTHTNSCCGYHALPLNNLAPIKPAHPNTSSLPPPFAHKLTHPFGHAHQQTNEHARMHANSLSHTNFSSSRFAVPHFPSLPSHCTLHNPHHTMSSQTADAGDNGGAANYTVMIVASAPVGSGLVHAVTVTQPAQSWTVIRGQDDFVAIGNALQDVVPELPLCPQSSSGTDTAGGTEAASSASGDINSLVRARNDLQQWLNELLVHESVRSSPAIINFLTYAVNMIPPQFEGIPWTSFAPDGSVLSTSQPYGSSGQSAGAGYGGSQNLDDMEMDEMFDGGDDDGASLGQGDTDDEDDFHRQERYRPIDEEVTMEDEEDFLRMAREVEMVEDVGSLAQSMGAKTLGKSLQLQAELGAMRQMQAQQSKQEMAALELGTIAAGNAGSAHGGGIGNIMESAGMPSGEGVDYSSFTMSRPESAPRLDSFKLIRVIGKGSFGKVFLVKELKTHNAYALKVLKKDNIIRRNQVEHTKTERSVLGYVKHPFIVGMNMAFQSSSKLFFVLDYCAGGELFFHLQKVGKFSESRARFYTAEILLAISYVHSLDIIYRDLKPENVLLDAQGHIRLTDFGLSKEGVTSSSSGAYSFCGTPEYLSPEILDRKGHGFAVDWWSLGALLYEMLTSLPPFYCENRDRLFDNIRKRELQYPGSLSSSSRALLKGLLTKDPKKRLGSGPSDADEIKAHEFFNPIDWDKLKVRDVKPPWVPQIKSDQDTSQFDKEFTNMPFSSPHSLQRSQLHGKGDNAFEGFTWTDRRGTALARQAQRG